MQSYCRMLRNLLLATVIFAIVTMSCAGEVSETAIAPPSPEPTVATAREAAPTTTPVRPAATPEIAPTATPVAPPDVPLSPQFEGTKTYEEKILYADVIARVRFVSVAPGVEVRANDRLSPAMLFTFTVLEYLRGSGGTTIQAIVIGPGAWAYTRDDALERARGYIAARDTTYDSRQAILFLERHDTWPSTLTGDRYYLGEVEKFGADAYSIAGRYHKPWLPVDTSSTSSTTRNTDGSALSFLLDDPQNPTAEPPIEGSSGARSTSGGSTAPTLTMASLKAAIARITAEAAAGSSAAHARCMDEKYRIPRWMDYSKSQGYVFTPSRYEMTSGEPAGYVLGESPRAVGLLPDYYGTYTFTGAEAHYFELRRGPKGELFNWGSNPPDPPDAFYFAATHVATRPLSAGEYTLSSTGLPATDSICNADITGHLGEEFRIYTISVSAPAFAVYEAMFNPIAAGNAIMAVGVLKPYNANGESVTVSAVSWASGTLTVRLDPVTVSWGRIDFIALDGSVALSVDVRDSTVDSIAKTLSWTVTNQPWVAGDKMMLRVYR